MQPSHILRIPLSTPPPKLHTWYAYRNQDGFQLKKGSIDHIWE